MSNGQGEVWVKLDGALSEPVPNQEAGFEIGRVYPLAASRLALAREMAGTGRVVIYGTPFNSIYGTKLAINWLRANDLDDYDDWAIVQVPPERAGVIDQCPTE